MLSKSYPVQFEISGPAAAFFNPATGAGPVSYPVPTRSALKSIFECVVMAKDAYFVPEKVEICTPVIYHRYSTNYGGPLKKSGTANFQQIASVLTDVCYKVYGYILSYKEAQFEPGKNPRHSLQEVFLRRLEQGQFYMTPCLGLSDFPPSYFGILRECTRACESVNLKLSSLLDRVYDRQTDGAYAPKFLYNVEVRGGVLNYVK